MYVDSHDYAPEQPDEKSRFAGGTQTWAENLDLMFTFRGIPCVYYGSEVEFQKGAVSMLVLTLLFQQQAVLTTALS